MDEGLTNALPLKLAYTSLSRCECRGKQLKGTKVQYCTKARNVLYMYIHFHSP
jgi:hypothetical protein